MKRIDIAEQILEAVEDYERIDGRTRGEMLTSAWIQSETFKTTNWLEKRINHHKLVNTRAKSILKIRIERLKNELTF